MDVETKRDSTVIRSALFVPGTHPERIDKAAQGEADAVIIDLEDAVLLSEKDKARRIAREKIIADGQRRFTVRTNPPDSGLFLSDIEAVVVPGLRAVMIPKIESVSHVELIHQALLHHERNKRIPAGDTQVIYLIETAKSVQDIIAITRSPSEHERVVMVAFGAGDFCLDLGIWISADGLELHYARSRIVLACRAAELPPPLDAPLIQNIHDIARLKEEAARARQFGFQGKLCIHPTQVPVVNDIFSPTESEIREANEIMLAFREAEIQGLGAVASKGRLIDRPVVERAKRVLSLAAAIGGSVNDKAGQT